MSQRKPLTIKAKNLIQACMIVENRLQPGEKYYKYATVIGNSDKDGTLQIIFSDEKALTDAA